jgi:tRNA threonylcarbamoyladenosine biosynthesis protein TsaE
VLLRGELGAGKTTLVRAVARGLGVAGPVTSPTFTVAQRYAGRVPVAHMDAYRIGDADDEEAELLADALGGGAVALVEWPDAVAALLPDPRLSVVLEHRGGDRRLVRLSASDAATTAALETICDHLRARHRHRQPERGTGAGP